MDATLHALVNLLIEAIPTVLFFIFLTVYLKATYFAPIARVLEERRKQTEGVRELAQKAIQAAEGKQSEFERALQAARAQIFEENEKLRSGWEAEQNAALARARTEVEAQLDVAKRDIAAEIAAAEQELNTQVEALSQQIAASVLRGRAA